MSIRSNLSQPLAVTFTAPQHAQHKTDSVAEDVVYNFQGAQLRHPGALDSDLALAIIWSRIQANGYKYK